MTIDALNSGLKWATPTVTYSFYSGGAHYDPAIRQNGAALSPISNGIRNAIRQILDELETYINIDFQEVAENGTDTSPFGQIRIQTSTDPDYAYTYLPGTSNIDGDLFFNPRYDVANLGNINAFQNGIGSYGYSTLVHELGHALGLEHPGNYSSSDTPPFLSYAEDNTDNTVITYNVVGAHPSTFMPYDVLTLQSMYGARVWNPTDTTYTFTTTSAFSDGSRNWGSSTGISKLALWDSGGADTLNFSGLAADATGYRFDLNEGGWLSRQSDFNTATYNAWGDLTNTNYVGTISGTRLAYGASIENAIGTNSSDRIIGNALNNWLVGGGGNDALWGGAGNDTVGGGAQTDILIGNDGVDEFLFGGLSNPFETLGIDWVFDFSAGEKLILSQATFTALTSITDQFTQATVNEETSSGLIVYNPNTGNLFYNPNGNEIGFGNGGHFAIMNGNPTLTATDFRLIT
jgi:serralysin